MTIALLSPMFSPEGGIGLLVLKLVLMTEVMIPVIELMLRSLLA